HIMAYGHFDGKSIDDPNIRGLFDRESLLASDWYRERLVTKQQRDLALWRQHHELIIDRMNETENGDPDEYSELESKLERIENKLEELRTPDYIERLKGTLGADWVHRA